jgi:hypothetical protein
MDFTDLKCLLPALTVAMCGHPQTNTNDTTYVVYTHPLKAQVKLK